MKVIVIGCGRSGSGLAVDLKIKGNDVVVVDSDPLSFERLGKAYTFTTIVGIGFDREVLVQAGIESSDALAAVMGSDEANVVAARIAKQIFNVPKVVARVNDPRKAVIYRRLGIPTISPVAITSARMSELLAFKGLATLNHLGGGQASLVELEVAKLLSSKPVSALDIPGKAVVVALTRNGRTTIPAANVIMEFGDIVHMVVLEEFKDQIFEFLL
jgi:trk system potassium uptake protein TrkA